MNQRAAAEEREEAEMGAPSECGYSEDGSQLPSVSTSGDVGEGGRKGKGRCKYAPEERERIRRERNRIHAKRTRDRRKKFMMDSEKVRAGRLGVGLCVGLSTSPLYQRERDHHMTCRCLPSSA
jgi:hypothetical protein